MSATQWDATGQWEVDGWIGCVTGNDESGYQVTITSPVYKDYDNLEEWDSVVQKAVNDFTYELRR